MATVNAAREEFEAAKIAALPARWRKKPSSASSSSCSTSSSSSFWRRPRTSRNSGLPPSQTDKSVPGARARSRTGRWATTCARPSSRRRSRPATPAAPTSTAPSIGSAASSMTSCSRSSSAAPRSRNARSARPGPRAGSPTTSRAVRHRHSGPRHQPAGRPDAVPAPCRRVRASDLRHQALRGLGYAFTMRHGRRPPWRTSCNARPCMSTRPDFGSTVSGFMSWDPDVQVPAPQARPGGKRSASSRVTRASWASYMGQCSHQLCGSHLLRELTFVVEATAGRD